MVQTKAVDGMSGFYVELVDADAAPYTIPVALTLRPRTASSMALGGYDQCELTVEGAPEALWSILRWLRFGVTVRNQDAQVVWDGYVHEVQVSINAIAMSLSLDTMYNAVNVLHAYTGGDGDTAAETGWNFADDSIARYGRKDLLYSGSDILPSTATEMQARILADHAYAVPSLASGGNGGTATLFCRGWWHTLDWRYYQDTSGLHEQAENDALATLGYKATGSNIGFIAQTNRITDFGDRLQAIQEGDVLVASGASNGGNNVTHTVTDAISGDAATVTGTGISFKASDEMFDSNGGLGIFNQYDGLLVSGSPSNNGYYCAGDTGANRIETTTSWGAYPLVDESAGATVTIANGPTVGVNTTLTHETPSASVTLESPTKIAQSFQLSAAWLVGEVSIYVAKYGLPADNLKLEICANNSGAPGTVLDDATVPGTDIEQAGGWISFLFADPLSLAATTTYWLVLSRTGTTGSSDFYQVGISETAGYSAGICRYYAGSWLDRPTAADMAFQIWEVTESTSMISDIISGLGTGIVDVSAVTGSGVYTKTQRSERSTARTEVEALLNQGTSNHRRMIATTLRSRHIVVKEEPVYDLNDPVLRDDGRIYFANGQAFGAGVLPVGRWVQLETLAPADIMAAVSPFFVDAASYDFEADTWTLTPKGAPDVFDMGPYQG